MVVPGRYTSDPYVARGNKFPVSNQERRHQLAMVQIGTHETWCKYVLLLLCFFSCELHVRWCFGLFLLFGFCGTPAQSNRFTLHCQPRDQVFWQHTTTWYRNNRFIDASGNISLRLHRVERPSDTHGATEQYVHYLMNMKVPRSHKLRGSGTTTKWNSIAQGHRRGHDLDAGSSPVQYDLPEISHDTPGQYIERTCKLTTIISIMTNNIMTIIQVNAMQVMLLMRWNQLVHRVPQTRLPDGLPCNRTVIIPQSQLKPNTHDHLMIPQIITKLVPTINL